MITISLQKKNYRAPFEQSGKVIRGDVAFRLGGGALSSQQTTLIVLGRKMLERNLVRM